MKFLERFPLVQNAVIIFYMTLLTGWGDKLLPYKVMNILEEYRLAQLFATFFLIMFTIEVFNDKVLRVTESFSYSLMILLIYIIISKQEPIFFFISIILLLVIYLINKQKDMLDNDIKQEEKDTDTNKKNQINQTIKTLDTANNVLRYVTIAVIAYGCITYFIKQYKDHGAESHNIFTFFMKFLLEGSNQVYGKKARIF